jgi:hypothetical protein
VRSDTVRLAGSLLPELHYGGAGILRGGARAAYTNFGGSSDSLRIDLVGMLAIRDFCFALAAEDISSDSSRRYSYGIIWSFDDVREAPSAGGERGGGQ